MNLQDYTTQAILWTLSMLVVAIVCYIAYRQENREYRQKYGMTREDFRHYRKMMIDSSYRAKNKKSPAKAELTDSIHYN